MKLNIVPARTGMVWAKLGIKTFFRQPLAMAGLFFMFMAVLAVIGSIPVVGGALSMALLPAALVGLMAATREAGLNAIDTADIAEIREAASPESGHESGESA